MPCGDLAASHAAAERRSLRGDPAAVPSRAITLGLDDILSADEIHLIVTGAAKAEILRRSLLEPCQEAVPASWLQRHPRVHLWVDDAASAHLPSS